MAREVDFNLLRTLDALLVERSVSRAAEKLMLSQPATSAALARLRRHFDDELLMRDGNTYRLTPLAAQLLERTPDALNGLDRVFSHQTSFDPKESGRHFVLSCSDYSYVGLSDRLAMIHRDDSTRVKVELRQLTTTLLAEAPDSLQTVDGVVLPHGILLDAKNTPYLDLLRDEWVCLVANDNDRVGDTLTRQNLAELPWVITSWRPVTDTSAMRELRHEGIEPRIQLIVDSYASLPALVSGTNRIALCQKRLTTRVQARWPVRVLPCPVTLTPLSLALWWHPSQTDDPGHEWFRHMLSGDGPAEASL
ncbi:LysR family transcriptional regulator [Gordonia terrae]|uniref:LysR family transcriptional regulator n=1 Tax=Gordonia terrae TaxID=2055 RepID=UPI003F6AE9FB